MPLYILNALAAGAAAALLGYLIMRDWRNIAELWRGILLAGALEQVVLVWGCLEAWTARVPLDTRQSLFFLSVLALNIALVRGIVVGRRTGRFLHHRPPTGPPQG